MKLGDIVRIIIGEHTGKQGRVICVFKGWVTFICAYDVTVQERVAYCMVVTGDCICRRTRRPVVTGGAECGPGDCGDCRVCYGGGRMNASGELRNITRELDKLRSRLDTLVSDIGELIGSLEDAESAVSDLERQLRDLEVDE